MIDLAFAAHACISCAILGGLDHAWNAIAGAFGGIGGVLSPDGGDGAAPSSPGCSGSGGTEGVPDRRTVDGNPPPPAYAGPRSNTITPDQPTKVITPDGRTIWTFPETRSGGPTVPSQKSGAHGGSAGAKSPGGGRPPKR